MTATSPESGGRDEPPPVDPSSSRPPDFADLTQVRCPECKGRPTLREGSSMPAVAGLCATCCGRRTIIVHWAGVVGEPETRHVFVVGSLPHAALCPRESVKITQVTRPHSGSMPCMPCVLRLAELASVEDEVGQRNEALQQDLASGDLNWLHPE